MQDILEGLNNAQKEAVEYIEGPLLILAGAGSGKTRVLTHRIANMINKGIRPYNIMAITFTNKAAGEMRDRVDKIVEYGAEDVWVSTFHSACVKILRRYADRIGYSNDFSIYDTEDSKRLIKNVVKDMNLDPKLYKEKVILGKISDFKNKLVTVSEVRERAKSDYKLANLASIYDRYQVALKGNNAFDFDDLIMRTVELFVQCPDVLESYQNRLRYIMVDEYQDTNVAQFTFIRLLAGKYKNLCVVGDDDQSIYKFRGADIRNILQFEKYFKEAKIIKLEQNYRSTKNILNAANSVIKNNYERKDKTLWSDNEEGEKVVVHESEDAYEEAEMVSSSIKEAVDYGKADYSEFAILYRTNAQSRILEEKLMLKSIPYKIIGGQNFYQRREIKDILAYLRLVANNTDDIAVERIINVPKRGIGDASVERAREFASINKMNLYDALLSVDEIESLARASKKIAKFTNMIEEFKKDLAKFDNKEKKEDGNPYTLLDLTNKILDETGYRAELIDENTDEANGRLENIDELLSKVSEYENNTQEPSLAAFLEDVSLVSDIDNLSDDSSYVVLMTVHSAKGLEFPNVFLCGMEDGLFPSFMSIMDEDSNEIQEERRLCYVAITRAMKHLTISYAKRRMVRGETRYNSISRFIKEIPLNIVSSKNVTDLKEKKPAFAKFGGYEGAFSYDGGSGYMGGKSKVSSRGGNSTMRKKPAYSMPSKKPAFGKAFEVTKADIDYAVGDRVEHSKFGQGTVIGIEDGPRDYQVTVMFDTVGQKVMMASFAKLEKVD